MKIEKSINTLKIMLLCAATQLLFAASCKKSNTTKPCSSYTAYSFKANAEFLNEKEIYNINDTITLISILPKILIDYSTPNTQQIEYSNAINLGGTFGIVLLDSINHVFVPAVDSFSIIVNTGSITTVINPNQNISLLFQEKNLNYQLSVKIIAKKKGNYQIGLTDLGSTGIRGKDCTNAGFDTKIINANKHLHILTNAAIPGVSLDQYRVDHIYCFRVQ